MAVVSMLSQEEFEPNDHREHASHFSSSVYNEVTTVTTATQTFHCKIQMVTNFALQLYFHKLDNLHW